MPGLRKFYVNKRFVRDGVGGVAGGCVYVLATQPRIRVELLRLDRSLTELPQDGLDGNSGTRMTGLPAITLWSIST